MFSNTKTERGDACQPSEVQSPRNRLSRLRRFKRCNIRFAGAVHRTFVVRQCPFWLSGKRPAILNQVNHLGVGETCAGRVLGTRHAEANAQVH